MRQGAKIWDERNAGEEYLLGREPAAFLQREAAVLPQVSRVLCLADAEGRNSVYLAGLGHRVTAMEPSSVTLSKARNLAADRGVTIDFRQAGIEEWDWSQRFDALVGVFIQFAPPPLRAAIHAGINRAVLPGGLVVLHGYAQRQIANGAGGPRAVENLYTLDLLHADFPGWQVLRAADYDMEINEGKGHAGQSALIDFIAQRPHLAEAHLAR